MECQFSDSCADLFESITVPPGCSGIEVGLSTKHSVADLTLILGFSLFSYVAQSRALSNPHNWRRCYARWFCRQLLFVERLESTFNDARTKKFGKKQKNNENFDCQWCYAKNVKGFQNIESEILQETSIPVQGEIPLWLQGSLFRDGPGIFDIKKHDGSFYHINHWFDGIGVLHRFTIQNGKVTYKSRRSCPEA